MQALSNQTFPTETEMNWPDLKELESVPAYHGDFRIDQLSPNEIDEVIECIRSWYPAVETGSENCHLRREFYEREMYLKGGDRSRDILPFIVREKSTSTPAAFWTPTICRSARSLSGRLAVVNPAFRSRGLLHDWRIYCDALIDKVGADFVLLYATLEHRLTQEFCEKMGLKPVAILPGFDLDWNPRAGKAFRVTEIIYTKLRCSEDKIKATPLENMTPDVRRLYEAMISVGSLKPLL